MARVNSRGRRYAVVSAIAARLREYGIGALVDPNETSREEQQVQHLLNFVRRNPEKVRKAKTSGTPLRFPLN